MTIQKRSLGLMDAAVLTLAPLAISTAPAQAADSNQCSFNWGIRQSYRHYILKGAAGKTGGVSGPPKVSALVATKRVTTELSISLLEKHVSTAIALPSLSLGLSTSKAMITGLGSIFSI